MFWPAFFFTLFYHCCNHAQVSAANLPPLLSDELEGFEDSFTGPVSSPHESIHDSDSAAEHVSLFTTIFYLVSSLLFYFHCST